MSSVQSSTPAGSTPATNPQEEPSQTANLQAVQELRQRVADLEQQLRNRERPVLSADGRHSPLDFGNPPLAELNVNVMRADVQERGDVATSAKKIAVIAAVAIGTCVLFPETAPFIVIGGLVYLCHRCNPSSDEPGTYTLNDRRAPSPPPVQEFREIDGKTYVGTPEALDRFQNSCTIS